MAKSFNYNDPNAPKDNSYQSNSDGVNKVPGAIGNLAHIQHPSSGNNGIGDLSNLKNPSSGNNGIGDLSNLKNPSSGKNTIGSLAHIQHPSSGKNGIGDLSNLKTPSSGKTAIGNLSNLQNPSSGKNGIVNLSNLQNPSSGKNGISNLTHLQNPAVGQKMPKKTGGSSADGVNKKVGTLPLKTGGDSSYYTDWPLTKFAFIVDIAGFDGKVAFQGMDGLGSTVGKMEFRDGNSSKFYKQSRPTLTTFEPVTLKKGMFAGDLTLFNWYKNVSQGALFSDMRTVTIDLCEHVPGQGEEVLKSVFKWTLEKAYITKYTPSNLDGESDSEVAIEEIELTYQSFSMDAGDLGSILASLVGGLGGALIGAAAGALSGSLSASVNISSPF